MIRNVWCGSCGRETLVQVDPERIEVICSACNKQYSSRNDPPIIYNAHLAAMIRRWLGGGGPYERT